MFCLMTCLNVDDDIKNKSECLKGSSRILSFIKPDIEFYLYDFEYLTLNYSPFISLLKIKKISDTAVSYSRAAIIP